MSCSRREFRDICLISAHKKAICVHKSQYGLGAFASENIAKNTVVGGKSKLFLTIDNPTHRELEYIALICDTEGQAQALVPLVRF